MGSQPSQGLRSVIGWLVFPLVPVLLATTYHQTCNFGGPDPREWGWGRWVVLLGPLCGFGFLAGATAGLPDEPDGGWVRAWLSRRSVWVAIGPWMGFLFWAGVYWTSWGVVSLAAHVFPEGVTWRISGLEGWEESWAAWAYDWALTLGFFGSLSYGWLIPARAALRRAGRVGRRAQAFRAGLLAMVGFVGSLFGSFWAATEALRNYFFDPKIVGLVLVALSLALVIGCAGPLTAGEVRRRELFDAMLTAWVLGLALAWRWWGRSRSRPPGG